MLLECNIGYTGINCEDQCPYPTYGEICQKVCSCDSTLCDFSTGCKPNRKLIYIMRLKDWYERTFILLFLNKNDTNINILVIMYNQCYS